MKDNFWKVEREFFAEWDRIRKGVTVAFRELRKHGLFARQKFECCMNCALAAMELKPDQIGAVYYHGQDAAAWDYHVSEYGRSFHASRNLCIRYTGNDTKNDHNHLTYAIGCMVVKALKEQNLPVTWSGKPSEVIYIDLKSVAAKYTRKAKRS